MMGIDGVEPVLERAVSLLTGRLGLRPDPGMLSRVRRCLRDEAIARNQEPAAYVDTLAANRSACQSLFDRVTVQETSFFRHPGQFDALAHHVLPDLADPVSIWSAGCANGQEAYSLAMVLDEQARRGSVIATDVSTHALERTLAARYQGRELAGLSAARQARYLVQRPDGSQILPSLSDRVTVQHHNLVTDPIPDHLASCQIVFCRNVLIYFTPEHAAAFLTRLADRLPAGAYLFLGYAETIWQVTDLFEPVRIGNSFEYHRRRPRAPCPVRGVGSPARPLAVARPVGPARPLAPTRPPAPARTPAPAWTVDRSARIPVAAAAVVPIATSEVAGAGHTAAASGDYPAAISAFRKCVYLAPDEPIGHVHLGIALAASGDRVAAKRAFLAASDALRRCDGADVEHALGGYRIEELHGFLDRQQEEPCP